MDGTKKILIGLVLAGLFLTSSVMFFTVSAQSADEASVSIDKDKNNVGVNESVNLSANVSGQDVIADRIGVGTSSQMKFYDGNLNEKANKSSVDVVSQARYVNDSGKEYIIVGGKSSGVKMVAKVDPADQSIVSQYTGVSSIPDDIDIHKNKAYVISQGDDDIHIINMSDMSQDRVLTGVASGPSLEVVDNGSYVVASDSGNVVKIDLSDDSVASSTYSGSSTDVIDIEEIPSEYEDNKVLVGWTGSVGNPRMAKVNYSDMSGTKLGSDKGAADSFSFINSSHALYGAANNGKIKVANYSDMTHAYQKAPSGATGEAEVDVIDSSTAVLGTSNGGVYKVDINNSDGSLSFGANVSGLSTVKTVEYYGNLPVDVFGADSYSWTLENKSNMTGQNISVQYEEEGEYNISLVADDADGVQLSDDITLSVGSSGGSGVLGLDSDKTIFVLIVLLAGFVIFMRFNSSNNGRRGGN